MSRHWGMNWKNYDGHWNAVGEVFTSIGIQIVFLLN